MKKHTKTKKLLSVVLSVLMLMSVVPLASLPASAALSSAESSLVNYNADTKFNHSINYTYGKFQGDSSNWNSDAQYKQTWKNVIWADSTVKGYDNNNNSYDSGWITTGSGWNGSAKIVEHFYNHSAVVLYDGNEMKVPVAIMSAADKTGTWASWGRLCSCYLNNSGIGLETKWRTPNNQDTNTLDVQWLLLSPQTPVVAIRDKGNSWSNYNDGEWHAQNQGGRKFYATRLTFPNMSNTTYSAKYTPSYTYVHVTGDSQNYFNKVNGTSSNDPVYMVNYKVIKDTMAEAKTTLAQYKDDINSHPGKYTTDSINAFVNALNLLAAANPSSYIATNTSKSSIETAVNNYATAAKKAVDAWNAAKTLKVAKYTVTFINSYNYDPISSAEYEYGQMPVEPAFQLTKNDNGTSHSVAYRWNTPIEAVTANVTYRQEVTQWEDCTWTDNGVTKVATCSDTGLKNQICNVCGNTKTGVVIPKDSTNHVGGTEKKGAVPASCYQAGHEDDTYCLGCGVMLNAGTVIPATGNHAWDEGEVTKQPTWNEAGEKLFKCTTDGCTATRTEPIPALGDTEAPAGSVTFKGYSVDALGTLKTIKKNSFEETPDFDMFISQGRVQLDITDSGSGVASVEYFIANKAYTLEEIKAKTEGWTATEVNASIVLPNGADGQFVVYVKATDNAGNTAYFSSVGYSVDKTAPVITLPDNKDTFCVSVEVTVTDANLDKVTLDGEEVELTDGKLTVNTAGDHTVVATDKGLKESTVTFTVNESHKGGSATCNTLAVCELCGEAYGDFNKAEHEDLVDVDAKEATCTEDGHNAYQHCNACGDDIGREDYTAQHNFAYRVTANRKHQKYCTVCFTSYAEEQCSGELVRNVDRTCTEDGYYLYNCDTCKNDYKVDNGQKALGHIYNETAVFNWTETEDGWTCDTAAFTCINCDHTEDTAATLTTSGTDATCTAGGTKTFNATATLKYTVTTSGIPVDMEATATDSKTVTSDPLGHDWGEVTLIWADDNSCEAVKTCNNCSETDKVQATVTSKVTTEATCQVAEVVTYTATVTVDGKEYTDSKDVTGTKDLTKHVDLTHHEATTSTCTVKGHSEYDECACGTKFGFEEYDLAPHTHTKYTPNGDGKHTSVCDVCGGDEITEDCTASDWKVDKESSCTQGGTKHKECTLCGQTLATETIDVKEHNYVETGRTPATCTTDEIISYACADCGVAKTEKGIDKLGHSFTNYVSDGNATCTADGTKTAKCDRCDATDTVADEDSKKGHTEVEISAVEATCEKAGSTAGVKCSECNEILVAPETIEKLGHSFTNYVSDDNATCTADGTKTAKCDRCDATDTIADEGSKLGHSFTKYVSNDDATCTEDGTETAKCDRCDVRDTRTDEDSKLGHSFTNYVSNNNATCTANATETAKCDRCDAEDTREIADSMLPHTHTTYEHIDGTKTHKSVCSECGEDEKIENCTPGEWIIDKEASYTEDGSKHNECTVCHAVLETETIPALNHHWGEVTLVWAADNTCKAVRSCTDEGCEEKQEFKATVTSDVTTEATCTVAEVVTYTATVTVDGKEYTDSKDVTGTTDPTKHTEVEIPAVEATCEKAGSTAGVKCSECNEILVAPETIEKLGHSFTNYVSNNNATCTADGTKTAKCDRCDTTDTIADEGSKKGHTEVEIPAVEATCEKAGSTAGVKCSECNEILVAPETIKALGHDWKVTYTWSTDNKTCTATRTCQNDASHKESKAANITSVTTPATCETDGSIVYTAKVTFDKEYTTTKAVTLYQFDHKYGDPDFKWSDDYSACVVTKTCQYDKNKTHVLTAEATVTSDTTPATCKAEGKIVYTATAEIDGQTVTETKEVTLKKLDHTFGEWSETKVATCKEAGTETRTCSACSTTETRTIAKLAHTVVVDKGYPATCGSTGLTDGSHCSVCGTIIKAQEVIPATGKHTDNDGDGVCDECGGEVKHEHTDADGDGKCDHCGNDMTTHHDNCLCHKNNIFSKILRYICTLLTKICHKRIACCPDMEYYGGRIKDLT